MIELVTFGVIAVMLLLVYRSVIATFVACNILAAQGVPAITLARRAGTAPQPRATVTNMRTVEVFRDLGIEDRMRSVGNSLRFLKYNVQATSLASMEIFRYTSYGTGRRP